MKANVFRMLRSSICLLLALCMVVGMCPVQAFATESGTGTGTAIPEPADREVIRYVSIGDSMTNGYGLLGYNSQSGMADYGVDTYGQKFAAYLAGYTDQIRDDQFIFKNYETGVVVDHRQLGTSGFRAADLHWLLELDYHDEALLKKVLEVSIRNGGWHADNWSGDAWYDLFETGDYRTNDDYVDPGFRLGQGAARVLRAYHDGFGAEDNYYQSEFATAANVAAAKTGVENNVNFPGRHGHYIDSSDPTLHLKVGAEYFQRSVKDADIISLALGNTDIGPYMVGHLMEAMKIQTAEEKDAFYFYDRFPIDKVHNLVIDEMQGKVEELVGQFKTIAMDKFSGYVSNQYAREAVVDVFTYTVYNFLVNYIGAVDTIINANEDVDIIQIALMNPYESGAASGDSDSISIATVVDALYTPVNTFISALPGYMQKEGKWTKANFYYAETPFVECMANVFGDDFYTVNGDYIEYPEDMKLPEGVVPNGESIVRDRLLGHIVSQRLGMLSGVVSSMGVTIDRNIDVSTVNAYETMSVAQKAAILSGTPGLGMSKDTAITCALYLAMENAMIRAGAGDITLDSLGAVVGGLNVDTDAIKDRFTENVNTAGSAYKEDATEFVAESVEERSNGMLTKEMVLGLLSGDETIAEQIYTGLAYAGIAEKVNKQVAAMANVDSVNIVTAEDVATMIAGGEAAQNQVAYKIVDLLAGDDLDAEQVATLDRIGDHAFACAMVAQQLTAAGQVMNAEAVAAAYSSNNPTIVGYVDNAKAQLAAAVSGLTTAKGAMTQAVASFETAKETAKETIDGYDIPGNVQSLCMILALPEALGDALYDTEELRGLLCLDARMNAADGIGAHPSAGGHQSMYDTLVKTYGKYTSNEEAKKDFDEYVMGYMWENYPNLMSKLGATEGLANMDDLAIIITMLKMKQADNPALAEVDLDALEAQIRELQVKFQEKLTPEEQVEAMKIGNDLMAILQEVASKATYHEYEVTEDSFYISLGDSNVNGYGLPGYNAGTDMGLGQLVEGTAPVELAKKLYGEGWEKRFAQYAQGALRSEDMLLILGEDEGVVIDDYWTERVAPYLLKGNLEDTQKAYIEAIEKADLISIAVGGGNVTTFVGEQMDRVYKGEKLVKMDWKKLGIESETLDELNELLDVMVPIVDAMGILDSYLPEGMEIENPAKFARTLVESLLYGYASYNLYYPQILERIREINPDAQLLIIGMFNPVDDWTLTTNRDGEEKVIPIGGAVGNVMAAANIQNLAYAAQNGNTTFVNISDAKTFLDARIEAGETITFTDYYKEILLGNGVQVHANEEGHAYMFDQMYASLQENYNVPYEAMYALYDYLRNYMIENGTDKVLGDAYEFLERNGYIAEMNKALDELMAQIEKELNDYLNHAEPELRGALTLLTEEAEKLNEQLLALKGELDAKVAELEKLMASAANETNADILAAIEATKAAIATIEGAIVETEKALAEIDKAIEACVETLDDLEEAIRYLDNRVVELDAKIAELNNVLNSGSNESIEAVMESVAATREAVESTIKLVQTAVASAAELSETVAELSVKAAEAMQNAAENALTILEGLSDEMKNYTEEFAAEEIEKIKAKYAEEIALLENNKELILAAGALAAKVVYDRESQPDGAITALNAKIEQGKKDLETAEGEAKDYLDTNLPIWEQELKDLEAKVEAEAQEAHDKAVAEAEVAYNMTLAYIEEMLPKVQAEMEAAIAEAQAAYAQVKPIIDAAIPVIENILANSETVLAAVEAAVPMAMDAVEKAVQFVIDTWNQAYNNATTSAYLLNSDSYYIALGDSSAYGEKTYVDELAAELKIGAYKNLSSDKNDVLAQMQALATDKALQAEVAKADLITVGFSQVPMINGTIESLMAYLDGKAEAPDWAKFVGEENVRYINAIRDELVEGFTTYMDEPMDEATAKMVTAAIEAYAYGVTAYACVIPEMVNAIHAINPHAVVTLVGLYNPLDGVTVDIMGQEFGFGEYIDYLVTGAQVHGTAYSMITGNSIYVNAPAVETVNEKDTLALMDLVELISTKCAALNPSANGHDYIQKCIYEALFTSNPAVKRVFGEDRYETALAAADTMLDVTGAGKFDAVVVATGRDFADALAGSYLAAEMDAPILLIKDSKADLVAGYIAENLNENGVIYVLGGEAVVSAATFAKLEKVGLAVRLEGENRYETNLAILNEAGAKGGELLIATGKNYADALSASSTGLPVMLVSSSLKAEQKEFLANAGFSKLTILGGTAAVSEELANELAAYGNVNRIAGATRYETSAAIADHYFGGRNGSVVVASGRDFPDALCGGALAAAAGIPVVMTKHGGIEAADNYAVKAALGIVLGGEATGITKQDIVDIFELLNEGYIKNVPYVG